VTRRRGRCSSCGELADAWVIRGWDRVCADCAYEIEYGPAKRIVQEQPVDGPPQDEQLFDANVYVQERPR
jgi:hypothetical protein